MKPSIKVVEIYADAAESFRHDQGIDLEKETYNELVRNCEVPEGTQIEWKYYTYDPLSTTPNKKIYLKTK